METARGQQERIRLDRKRCLAARRTRGWSQIRVAEAADLGLATVKRLEAGRSAQASSALAYAAALELPLSAIRQGGIHEDERASDAGAAEIHPGRVRLDRERCLEARRNKGWSRDRLLSLAVGDNVISLATVKRLERGTAVQLESARCYAAILGVSIRSLMAETFAPRRFVPERPARQLIGRAQEVSLLLRGIRRVRGGATHVILAHGPAGVGKTSLLERLREELSSRRIYVCMGQGSEVGGPPFQALIEALSDLPLDVPGLATRDRESVCRWLDPRPDGGHDSAAEYALFRAIWNWLVEVSREEPLVLIVDDLHWLDPESLRLLELLTSWASRSSSQERARLLILACSRPAASGTEISLLLERMIRMAGVEELPLAGLDREGTRQMLVACDVSWPSNQLVEMMLEATDGNPGFIRAAVKFLRGRDLLVKHGGSTSTRALAGEIEFPANLTAAFLEQCRSLSHDCRHVLIPAAFLGARFHLQALAQLVDQGEEKLRSLLAEAVHAGLLENYRQTFSFAHPLVRHLLYHEPIPAEREGIHLSVGRLLAEGGGVRPVEVAEHLLRAESLVGAEEFVESMRAAAQDAVSGAAFHQGAHFAAAAARRARESEAFEPQVVALLDEEAALALHDAWDLGPALEHYEYALSGYTRIGDRVGRARVLDRQSRALGLNEGRSLDPELLHAALDDLGDAEPTVRASLLCTLADLLWPTNPTKAEAYARDALALARRCEDDDTLARVMNSLALSHYSKVEIREALANWEEGLRIASRIGNPTLECEYAQRIPLAHFALGDGAALDESLRRASDSGERVDNPGGAAIVAAVGSQWVALRGDLEAALEHIQLASDLAARSRFYPAITLVFPIWAWIYCQRGEFSNARAALAKVELLSDAPGLADRLKARYGPLISAYEGTTVEAARSAPEDRSRARGIAAAELARACLALELTTLRNSGSPGPSSVSVIETAAAKGLVFATGWPVLIPRLLAVASSRSGRHEMAEERFLDAITIAEATGARIPAARTRLDYARFLESLDVEAHRKEASRQRGLAREEFDAMGMPVWARLAGHRGDPPSTPFSSRDRYA